jgi:hypothetical protein
MVSLRLRPQFINSLARLKHQPPACSFGKRLAYRNFSTKPTLFAPMTKDHILTLTCPDKSGIVYAVRSDRIDLNAIMLAKNLAGYRIASQT